MRNDELITQFLLYEEKVKALSENTRKNYSIDLEKLLGFAGERNLDFASFAFSDAKEFMRELKRQNLSDRSSSRILVSCHTFFAYLERNGEVDYNAFDSISLRSTYKRLPSVLTREEVKELLGQEIKDFKDERNHILFLFLYNTGCRISEALSVDVDDIEWGERRIRILGKGNKERYEKR